MKTTKQIHSEIINSSVFYSGESDIDVCEKLIELCEAINLEEETDWGIGEFETASLDEVIVGAYWALTEWHGGQSSPEYAALSQLGTIYKPNMENGPEDRGVFEAHECFCDYFRAKNEAQNLK